MQLQKNISKIGILSAIFILSCSAAPSPRDISISIHIDDLDQQTRGGIHTQDGFNSTLDFNDLNSSLGNYGGLQWSHHFQLVQNSPFASSPPNLVFIIPNADEGNPFFQTLPDSPENSFDLYELKISVLIPLTWPPPEPTLTIKASPADGGKTIVQQHTMGGIDNSRYPITLSVPGITRINRVELVLTYTRSKEPVIFAVDDIMIGWKKLHTAFNRKQTVIHAK